MTKTRVWEELKKAKSYILGIEKYTHKKRQYNRGSKWLSLFLSLVCAFSSFFPDWRWATIVSSILIAITTLIKEFKPILGQPEEELNELDHICDFYKSYLKNLERFYSSQCYNSTYTFEEKMIEEFEKIINTEGDNETKLKRLCRDRCWEYKEVQKEVTRYFNYCYPNAKQYLCY